MPNVHFVRYRLLLASLLVAPLLVAAPLVGAGSAGSGAAAGSGDPAPPAIRHVFVINLENKSYDRTFGPDAAAPYLARTLTAQGALLRQYYGTGHNSLDNYISQVSGQAPNPETQGDCPNFHDVLPGVPALDGQVVGSGCVYPASVLTIADQMEAAGLSWKGYMQDMGNDPAREPATCAHPALDTSDNTQTATPTDSYATRHNPFVYFHSIIDRQAVCDARVVPFTRLSRDLQKTKTTPNLTYITPSLCDDGHDSPCADGRPGGLVSADQFLRQVIPLIQASPAYKADGLIVVTFDESDGAQNDSTACCNEPTGPNTPAPGITGPGGGRTGTVLLSRFIVPGTVTDTGYNHYSLLRSLENVFGLSHLGYAAQAGLQPFGADIYTNPTGGSRHTRVMAATGPLGG